MAEVEEDEVTEVLVAGGVEEEEGGIVDLKRVEESGGGGRGEEGEGGSGTRMADKVTGVIVLVSFGVIGAFGVAEVNSRVVSVLVLPPWSKMHVQSCRGRKKRK